jgi:DNA-directed RNA polymerase specialized sigma24 family protein
MDELEQFCGSAPRVGFERLLETYGGFLRNFLRSKFSQKTYDENRLKEYLQETWLKVWASRLSFCASSQRNFRAWLFQIGVNEVMQDIRKKRPEIHPHVPDQAQANSPGPDEQVFEAEQVLEFGRWRFEVENHDLYRCMRQLKSNHEHFYDALICKYLGEAAEKEVLDKHKIDRDTLYRWRYEANQRVRNCMLGAVS